MGLAFADRVRETTTTSGTGTVTLAGAVAGYQSFTTAFAANQVVSYCLVDGSNWEVGLGTFTNSGTTLSRDTVFASSSGGSKITLSGSAAQVFLTHPAYLSNGPQLGRRNFVHNAEFNVNQRGTGVVALSTTMAYVNVDRWAALQVSGSVNAAFTPVTTSLPVGFQTAMKVGRASANTNTAVIAMCQAFESRDSIRAQGKYCTLSFYAKAGANYSSSGSALTAIVQSGTGSDQSVASMQAGTWSGAAQPISSAVTLTTSWQRFTVTLDSALASTITQLGVQFQFTPVGTAGADDSFYITGVQLEAMPFATDFDHLAYEEDLRTCQRFLLGWNWQSGNDFFGAGYSISTAGSLIMIAYAAVPRVKFTGISSSGLANLRLGNGSNTTGTPTAVSVGNNGSLSYATIVVTTTAGSPTLVAGQGAYLVGVGAAQILFTGAEM